MEINAALKQEQDTSAIDSKSLNTSSLKEPFNLVIDPLTDFRVFIFYLFLIF